MEFNLPIIYSNLIERLEYKKLPLSYRRSGQFKLYLDLCIFSYLSFDKNKNNIILYIGSAPGDNILYFLNECKSNNIKVYMYLYDSEKHNKKLYNRDDCEIIEKYADVNECMKYKDIENLLFFSDIRTKHSWNKEPNTENILNDNKIQNSIIEYLQPRYSFLKHRLPFPDDYNGETITYPYGVEYLQIDSGWSNERRLFVSKPIKFINLIVDLKDENNILLESEEKMMAYNSKINTNRYLSSKIGKFHLNNYRNMLSKPILKSIQEFNEFRDNMIKILY